jgi:transposase-like protein
MAFKQEVIRQLESGRFDTISEAREHYGIGKNGTINNWLRRYGRNHLCAKVIRVEKPDEKDQIRQLKNQIRQLKEALGPLGQSHAEKVLGDAFLEIACEKLGEDVQQFKKKADTMRSIKPENPDQ